MCGTNGRVADDEQAIRTDGMWAGYVRTEARAGSGPPTINVDGPAAPG